MLNTQTITFITQNLIYSAVILLLAIVGKLIMGLIIKSLVNQLQDDDPETISDIEQRTETLAGLANNVAKVAIAGTAFVMILSQWGINIAPILTGAGILGLAVGFGTQSLVKDIVTGFFILVDNQYNAGDKVKIAGLEGTVESMNIRTTVLRGEDGKKYLIPNSSISTIERH